ncbi:MAG: asparagine synthase (glutamine-hydrolyzing) [Actinomycetota bacterium]|nr:asparagine synthase (glutamine-hydrolyzing) [Actinomycetota bacterium]
MCGIAGILTPRADDRARSDVESMVGTLRHRGPDGEGVERVGDSIFLGHNRLKIIDLTDHGSQPMPNEAGDVWVVFNGEIYNFRSLRDDLVKRGHTFRSNTDTEVVVHLYEEFGLDSVKHLDGMFGFALWDGRRKRLFLARDRLGIKPLLYAVRDRGFTFASELRGFLALEDEKWHLDWTSFGHYVSSSYVPSPRTILKEVRRLLPAQALTVEDDGTINEWQYWCPPAPDYDGPSTSAALASHLRSHLERSVSSHLISDVPLGAFLSGGVDSSAIVALMAQQMSESIVTVTVGYTDPDLRSYDERGYARLVARRFRTDHHEIIVTADELLPLTKWALNEVDEPFGDSSLIPTYLVSQVAKEHMTVALTGDGGDELFGGYRKYVLDRLVDGFPPMMPLTRLTAPFWGRLPERGRTQVERSIVTLKQFLRGLDAEPMRRWVHYQSPFERDELSAILTPGAAARVAAEDSGLDKLAGLYRSAPGKHLDRLFAVDLQGQLPDRMLMKIDSATMANSLEARVPMLATDVVEFVSSIPGNRRIGAWRLKKLLKQAFAADLPHEILHRHKGGFAAPLRPWLRTVLRPEMDALLDPDRLSDQKLFDPGVVAAIRAHHLSGAYDKTPQLWNLMMFQSWFDRYSDRVLA